MKFGFRFLTPVLAVLGLALASAPAALAAEAKGEPIRIPMMESFSGAAADWGEDMWTGAVVAQKIINMRGGIKGRPIEFYKADAPYDDLPTSVSSFKKLARDPNVTMIFDGGATSVIAAVHDLTGDAKLPSVRILAPRVLAHGPLQSVGVPRPATGPYGAARPYSQSQEEVRHQEGGTHLCARRRGQRRQRHRVA